MREMDLDLGKHKGKLSKMGVEVELNCEGTIV